MIVDKPDKPKDEKPDKGRLRRILELMRIRHAARHERPASRTSEIRPGDVAWGKLGLRRKMRIARQRARKGRG